MGHRKPQLAGISNTFGAIAAVLPWNPFLWRFIAEGVPCGSGVEYIHRDIYLDKFNSEYIRASCRNYEYFSKIVLRRPVYIFF
jgi:hypothetical protein